MGHAYSALLNHSMAKQTGGRFLLRIEDIDLERCRPDLESQMLFDLEWLGLEWAEEPRRQSEHFDDYRDALDTLSETELVYPAFMSRKDIRLAVANWGGHWPSDPDGVPHYPGDERNWPPERREAELAHISRHALRLDMARALHHTNHAQPLVWTETGHGRDGETGTVTAAPERWGDVVLGRSDVPASYHLAVVLDDALQGITHVVRGRDLFHATSVHVLLQKLLGLPAPVYHHHELVLDDDGEKLSKRRKDTSIRALREAGTTPNDIARMVGLAQ